MNKLLTQMHFNQAFYYRVEAFDDIDTISNEFHTTPAIIIAQNNLTESITAGQLLYITVISGREYIVQPQDSLQSLSENDSQKLFLLKNKNMIDSIYVGQKIII